MIRRTQVLRWATSLLLMSAPSVAAQPSPDLEAIASSLEPRLIEWRRDIHRNPELSNREVRTARVVAEHLRALGIEVATGVAHTGVVGIIRGARPGPVVALRADMDALPVEERNDLPFRSTATGQYRGETVPVMHACGHDAHVAILMGVAEAIAGMRGELSGTVKLIFQPAEEGPPEGEEGGAELMAEEGVLGDPDVDAIFALHVEAQLDVGKVRYRSGPYLAGADDFRIVVRGRQTHGARPAAGIDPIVTASQIVLGLQTIVSRSLDLTQNPAVLTVGSFRGGVRSNIVPEEVELLGTVRTFDADQRETVHRRMHEVAENVAASAGASASVEIPFSVAAPVTYNDPDLTSNSLDALRRAVGAENVVEGMPVTVAEDFSYFAQEVPGFYFHVGAKPLDVPAGEAADHHTPDFFLDEGSLAVGVKAMLAVALDFLEEGGAR